MVELMVIPVTVVWSSLVVGTAALVVLRLEKGLVVVAQIATLRNRKDHISGEMYRDGRKCLSDL